MILGIVMLVVLAVLLLLSDFYLRGEDLGSVLDMVCIQLKGNLSKLNRNIFCFLVLASYLRIRIIISIVASLK